MTNFSKELSSFLTLNDRKRGLILSHYNRNRYNSYSLFTLDDLNPNPRILKNPNRGAVSERVYGKIQNVYLEFFLVIAKNLADGPEFWNFVQDLPIRVK